MDIKKQIMYKKYITNVKVVQIDLTDYPDFVDAWIESADYYDEPMNDEQIEELNEDRDYVYEQTINAIL